ncbi:MAG: UDP-N-acetylmuramoyl-tripeptide--D-alanyl-D-alanine ligase [Bacteroidota bacterium]
MTSIEQLYTYYRQYPLVVTDSRQLSSGSLFFALKGERFDGNKFAEEALSKGAAYAVIDDPAYQKGERCLLVEDVLTSLQQLATHHRTQFDIPILAITGSNGKTTTKEVLHKVLAAHYRTHATNGNFNNHIGVPLTLLRMSTETEIAIIEMGANRIGDIEELCKIARPTHGLITNVGKAHLEGFGSEEGVRQGKSELYRFLAAHRGVAFINIDEPHLSDLAAVVNRRLYYYRSETLSADPQHFEIKVLGISPYVRVAFREEEEELICHSRLIGAYNVNNIMTGIAVGQYFKVPADQIKAAIESYIPKNNRSELLEYGGNHYILDAYNANPNSMRGAIDHFASLPAAPKMAILGDMLELGPYSQAEHQALVDYAGGLGFEELVLVGAAFGELKEPGSARHFADVTALRAWFDQQAFGGYHILLKGSRGIGLERLLKSSASP